MAAQRELDTIAGSLEARLKEQTSMYKDAVEEMRLFKVHAHATADEYKAFVDAQNDGETWTFFFSCHRLLLLFGLG